MLSYLHGFHAGNPADVIKHAVLALALDALLTKPKPMVYIDTHAGAGHYSLIGERACKTSEFKDGIARLWPRRQEFPELAPYLAAVAAANPTGALLAYPGSPQLARHILRADDRLILMEWHKGEVQTLRRGQGSDPRIAIHQRDGFEGLPALLPPKPPRGLVLIDPPYEVKSDYKRVVQCLAAAQRRWPSAVYAIWFPRLAVARDQAEVLLRRIEQVVPEYLLVDVAFRPQADEFGMHGSGFVLINPPWRLDERLTELMPRLVAVLAGENPEAAGAGWRVVWWRRPVAAESS